MLEVELECLRNIHKLRTNKKYPSLLLENAVSNRQARGKLANECPSNDKLDLEA